jgi:hypothetical protein
MSISPALPKSLVLPSPRWGFLSWARLHPWTLLAIFILLVHAIPFFLKQHSEWEEVYLRAAGRLIYGGDMYRFEDGYSYPPFMALLAIPFTALPTLVSRTLWFGINVACLGFMWLHAWRLTGGGKLEGLGATENQEQLICFLGLACSLRYALNGIAHHQTDVVIGALLLGGCGLLYRGHDWSAATSFGLAAAMKCTGLLWCPYLLWRGKWKAAAWLIVVAAGVNLLPNLVRAPDRGGLWFNEWLTRYVRPLTSAEHYPGQWGSWIVYNQSISGAGNRWFTTQWGWRGSDLELIHKPDPINPMIVKTIVYGAETILFLSVAFVLHRRRALAEGQGGSLSRDTEALEYCVVLLLMVLLSPMSSKPHFCTLILPGFALARIAVHQGDIILRIILAAAVVIAALSLPLWGGRFDFIALWLGSETWNAMLLLIGCAYGLLAPRRGQPPTISFKPSMSCSISSADKRPIRFPTRWTDNVRI